MGGDHRRQAENPGRGERDEHGEDEPGQGEVLAHDAPGTSGVVERGWEVAEVLAEEGDVGGLDSDIAASGTHRNPDIGGGKGGGIVDAVTDHGGGPGGLELGDQVELVGWKELGMDVVDAIARTPRSMFNDKPTHEQKMKTVTVETFGEEYAEPETC